jgi:glutamine amidotransferase
MQMMAQRSEEGVKPGLGWIEADVKRFDATAASDYSYLPHIGWNNIEPATNACLFSDIMEPRFYFLHSYYIVPAKSETILSTTEYNVRFTSSVRHKNIAGTQFHPEKSHHWGIQLLKNFAEL